MHWVWVNYFCTCLDEFEFNDTCSRVFHLSIRRSRAHRTWQYLEILRIFRGAWICLECCIFSFASSLVNVGRGSDDREPICHFINETMKTNFVNLFSFETTNSFENNIFSHILYTIQYQSRMELKISPWIDTSRHVHREENSERYIGFFKNYNHDIFQRESIAVYWGFK